MTTGPALLLVLTTTAPATEPVGSPGLIGFLVTLALVLACIPLFRSMTSKVRRVQYRDHADDAAATDSAVTDSAAEGSEEGSEEGSAAEGSAAGSAGTGVAPRGGSAPGDAPGRSASLPAADAG